MDSTIRHIQTNLQEIIIEKGEDDLKLTLNGDLQFSFKEDSIYTNAMSLIPMRFFESKKGIKVLILGGGDGFIADKIRQFSNISDIELCELDSGMIELCKTDDDIRIFNHDVFIDPKLHVHIEDAFTWIGKQSTVYDLIIADFPDANALELSKLYSVEFYKNINNLLDSDGVFITIASEIRYTQSCFECIIKTLNSVFDYLVPFSLYMPETYGKIGLIMVSKADIFHNHCNDLDLYFPQRQDTIEINTIKNNLAYTLFHEETLSSGFIPGITNKKASNYAN